MSKKRLMMWVIIGLIVGMLVPAPIHLKDGGTVEYKAFLYKITKLHRMTDDGFGEGTIIQILGMEVYNNAKLSSASVKELNQVNEEIQSKTKEETNYSYSYVDEVKRVIIVYLNEDNEETEKWFKENITNYENILFKKAPVYSTSILYMYVKDESLTKKSATIIIEDIGSEKHDFDSSYYIEKKANDNWEKIEYIGSIPDWSKESFTINENGKIEQNLNWEFIYGELSAGVYRIVKNVSINNGEENEPIRAEFIIYK